jgi:hypothetical protein
MFSGKFVILFILNTFVSITVFPQVKILSENTKIKPEKVVKIRTTVTPRKSNVVFVGKAMEVIITPLDEFNNEINEIPSGLNVYLSISDAVAEHDQVGRKIIYGKTYLYLTPLKPHYIPNVDVLKVGTFLQDSITGLPNLSTGEFTNVLVAEHAPIPPKLNNLRIKSEIDGKTNGDNIINFCVSYDPCSYELSWDKAIDSNDIPLKKSFAVDPNDTRYWIEDQCKVKYSFKIQEYPDSKFRKETDTNNYINISSVELQELFTFLRTGSSKTVSLNCFVVCEDEVYKYSISEYSDRISSNKKKIDVNQNCPSSISGSDLFPSEYSLEKNYPNPFNPNTTIKIGLPKESNINVSIYNIFGQNIKVLLNKKEASGFMDLSWDGKNDKGVPVSSGMYFCIMTSGDIVKVLKMNLIK